jgi:acyl-CoA thioester hydrolase
MVSSNCTFVASCAFPAVLELGLRVNQLGASSVTYEVGIFEEGVEGVKAVGGFTHVFCDSVRRRPMTLLRTYREGLEKLLVRDEAEVVAGDDDGRMARSAKL